MQPESELPEDERQARDAARELRLLQESRGWAILKDIIERQIKNRTDMVMLSPRGDMKTEWDHEYKKGEVSGMRFVLGILQTALENKEMDVDHLARNATTDDPDDPDTWTTPTGPARGASP